MGSDEEISQNVNKLSEVIHALNIASTGLDLLSLKWSQQPLKGRLSIPINLDPISWKRASKKIRSAIDELRIKDTSSFTSVENLNLNNAMREPSILHISPPKNFYSTNDYRRLHKCTSSTIRMESSIASLNDNRESNGNYHF